MFYNIDFISANCISSQLSLPFRQTHDEKCNKLLHVKCFKLIYIILLDTYRHSTVKTQNNPVTTQHNTVFA